MPLLLLNLLRQHWQLAILCLLALVIVLQQMDITHRKTEMEHCVAANALLEDANARLKSSVENQNAAISLLQADAAKKSRAAAGALKEAQKKTARYMAHAQQIQTMPQSGDECRDMKALIEAYFK